MKKWLSDAVIYNIYPQSFFDSNNDGIGDLNGICSKLDYIKEMGFSGIWLNPIYESPFRDAGYDISDFYKVAKRYGTNEDFALLAKEAHRRGIKVILDLVAGHTSIDCEWFRQSALPEKNVYTNRYIWTNSVWDDNDGKGCISGFSDRDGCYMKNFFYCQPALNYGFKNVEKDWQLPMDHPDCISTREELLNIMRFWSNLGADGFRVDMASSLVKNDPTGEGITELWNEIRSVFDKEYPDSILISEWGFPKEAIKAGFDIDFLLHFCCKAYTTLFRHEAGANQSSEWVGHSYFRKAGKGNINDFLEGYFEHYNATKGQGYISLPTGNHDMPRISGGRDSNELKTAYVFMMTMPGVPFVYYGDEIGMKNIENLPSKEGGYNRTCARTPMQWAEGKNKGFSSSDEVYLPTDTDKDAPTVESQLKDPDSLLNHTKKLISLRKEHPALNADGEFEVLEAGYPFVYKRFNEKETVYIAVNPSDKEMTIALPQINEVILENNISVIGNKVTFGGVSYLMYK